MEKSTVLGKNRTGIDMSPIDAKEMIALARITPPSSHGDEQAIAEMRREFDEWIGKVGDMSEMEEATMVKKWWNGKEGPPVTEKPKITKGKNGIAIASRTTGASIGYKFKREDAWAVYTDPLKTNGRDSLYVIAQRIGYSESDVVSIALK